MYSSTIRPYLLGRPFELYPITEREVIGYVQVALQNSRWHVRGRSDTQNLVVIQVCDAHTRIGLEAGKCIVFHVADDGLDRA